MISGPASLPCLSEYVGNTSFLVASMFPDLFLTCAMRTFYFLVLMLPTFRNPLNSSRKTSISHVF